MRPSRRVTKRNINVASASVVPRMEMRIVMVSRVTADQPPWIGRSGCRASPMGRGEHRACIWPLPSDVGSLQHGSRNNRSGFGQPASCASAIGCLMMGCRPTHVGRAHQLHAPGRHPVEKCRVVLDEEEGRLDPQHGLFDQCARRPAPRGGGAAAPFRRPLPSGGVWRWCGRCRSRRAWRAAGSGRRRGDRRCGRRARSCRRSA